jgi:two-component system, cell cycle sensor histidine kinase and response regulator CckA
MSPRILIVEDDTIIAAELEDRLKELGYDVCAKTGTAENAVMLAEGLQPDVVLMDIRLKAEMDGVEAAGIIRSKFDIPVIFLTAYADDDTLQRAKITSPYGYIIKPFEERELHTAIEIGLHKHKLEKKLRDSEQWLTATLHSIADGVVATDKGGRITFLNSPAEKLLGQEKERLSGLHADDVLLLLRGAGRIPLASAVESVLRQGLPLDLADHWLVGQDCEIPVEGTITPIRDHGQGTLGAVVVLRDVTARQREEAEREKLQARLFQAQKHDALAATAGSLIHEFNNLMTAIIGSASLILADIPPGAQDLREGAERIKWAGQTATSLLSQILPQQGRQILRPQVFDLDVSLARMVEGLTHLAGNRIEVRHRPGTSGHCVQADPAQIDEMITHLATNALEAMPEGGVLTLETDVVCLQDEDCREWPAARPGTFVCVSVADTGIGMDEETLARCFEPFYSTKSKNAGLGLPTVSSLLRQNGGWIDVDSIPGQGTTSHAYLPAVRDQQQAQTGTGALPEETTWPAAVRAKNGEQKRILLVEDDEKVQAAVAAMLRARGYAVFRAGCARTALELFEANDGAFDLLFSDVALPDKDGLDLADYCLSQCPAMGVLFTSGYTDGRSCWSLINERGYHFLQKPFELQELLAAVEQALHG